MWLGICGVCVNSSIVKVQNLGIILQLVKGLSLDFIFINRLRLHISLVVSSWNEMALNLLLLLFFF